MTPPKKQPSRPTRKTPARRNAGSSPAAAGVGQNRYNLRTRRYSPAPEGVGQSRYNLRTRRHRRDIYPHVYQLSRGGSHPILAGLLADGASNERISRTLFSYLDDRDYSALRATNSHIQTQLEIRESPDEQTRPEGEPEILMFEMYLPKCDEVAVGHHLVNSVNQAAYLGACPHDRRAAAQYIRRCEDLPAQDYVQGRLVNQARRHDVHTQNVCRRCRSHYHRTRYLEHPRFYTPQGGNRPMTNEVRLRDLVNWQEIHTCHECDILQRRLHPRGFNGCTCVDDIYNSHWRCWECTRHTFDLASQEAIHRVNNQNRIRRDADGNVKFNGWGRRNARPQCLCGRRHQRAPTNQYQTRQCIKCFGYIVNPQILHYAPLRRSVRIRNQRR